MEWNLGLNGLLTMLFTHIKRHKLNYSKTKVRKKVIRDFMSLLKEWKKIYSEFKLFGSKQFQAWGLDGLSITQKSSLHIEKNLQKR